MSGASEARYTSDSAVLWSRCYWYDSTGNRTRLEKLESTAIGGAGTSETTTYAYNALNQLTAYDVYNTNDSGSTVSWTLAYDANGNLTSRSNGTDVTNYRWNERDRLTQVELGAVGDDPTTVVQYVYDFRNDRIERRVRIAGADAAPASEPDRRYFFDGLSVVLEMTAVPTSRDGT